MDGNPSGTRLEGRFMISITKHHAGIEKDFIFLHLILPFDTARSKMGPFRGKMEQNVNRPEVEIRPVSMDDSAYVHLEAKLLVPIMSRLL
jgi:hypothetical protein